MKCMAGYSLRFLDYTEGGHYTVNVLVGQDEVISLHEDNIQRLSPGPTFDHGVILVLLRKLYTNQNSATEIGECHESQGVFMIASYFPL